MNIVKFSVKYFEELLSGSFMVLMFLATVSNVVARYFFGESIQWAEEFSRYAFIWVIFLGAVVCTKHKRHISIDSVVKLLPAPVQPWVNCATELLVSALMVIIIWYGSLLTQNATQTTATLNVPQYIIYMVVPASGVLGLLLFSERIQIPSAGGIDGKEGNLMLWIFLFMLILFVINVPIAWSMAIASALYMAIGPQIPLQAMVQRMIGGIDTFPLLAIPFFILAGSLMNTGGITDRLVRLARALVGHITGGLAHVVVVTNMIMAGMSGSGVADAAGTSTILIPAMKKAGYSVPFSAAIVGAAATIGPIIPPSIPFVIYGSIASVSVGRLLLGGAIPGVLMGIMLMIFVYILAKKRNYPSEKRASWRSSSRPQSMRSRPWGCPSSSWEASLPG